MKREAGLWIDHRHAVIVALLEQGEELIHINSGSGKRVRFSGASQPKNGSDVSHNDASEDTRDRRFDNHLREYYDSVISNLRNADSILIFGPGEAKSELQKRLEVDALAGRIVAIETSDKMTDGQITAVVRQHYRR